MVGKSAILSPSILGMLKASRTSEMNSACFDGVDSQVCFQVQVCVEHILGIARLLREEPEIVSRTAWLVRCFARGLRGVLHSFGA